MAAHRSLVGLVEMQIGDEEFIIGELQSGTILTLLEEGNEEKALTLARQNHIDLDEGQSVSPAGPSAAPVADQKAAHERKVVRPPEPSEFGPNIPATKESRDAQELAKAKRYQPDAVEAVEEEAKAPVQEPSGSLLGDFGDLKEARAQGSD